MIERTSRNDIHICQRSLIVCTVLERQIICLYNTFTENSVNDAGLHGSIFICEAYSHCAYCLMCFISCPPISSPGNVTRLYGSLSFSVFVLKCDDDKLKSCRLRRT